MSKSILLAAVAVTAVSVGTVVGVEAATDSPARAATAAFPAQCAASNGWTGYCLDQDSCVDAWIMDTNGNGLADQYWFDLDGAVDGEDCVVDSWATDVPESDGLLQYIQFDMDENQVAEASVSQAFTLEGYIQTVTCEDTNGNGPSDEVCTVETTTTIGAPTYDGLAGVLVLMSQLNGTVV